MMPRSLTVRIVAVVVLAQLVLTVGLVWAGLIFTRRQLLRAFNSQTIGRALSVDALVHYAPSGAGFVFNAAQAPPPRHLHIPDFYQVRDITGQLIAGNVPKGVEFPLVTADLEQPARHEPLPGADLRYWGFSYGGQAYRGVVITQAPLFDHAPRLRQPAVRVSVYYASPLIDVQREADAAGAAIGGISGLLLLLTSLLAAWMVRRELHPLRELAQQAAGISPRNWNFEPNPRQPPTELAPLIDALQRMLHGLRTSFQQQRDFMADAAHHLKTPVAVAKSTLQSMLQRARTPNEYQAGMQATLADVERLEAILQRLLRLARLEHTGRPVGAPADLSATCQAALERVQPLAEAHAVELRGEGLDRPHWLAADADDLELAWLNLLENAVQHSPPQAPVVLTCRASGDAVRIEVRDHGPGVSPADAPHIFDRFRRGTGVEHPGSGLGLAITRAIIRSYGGTIAVAAPAAGTGAIFSVVLPLAAGPAGS